MTHARYNATRCMHNFFQDKREMQFFSLSGATLYLFCVIFIIFFIYSRDNVASSKNVIFVTDTQMIIVIYSQYLQRDNLP